LSNTNSKKLEEYYMKVGTLLKLAAGAAYVLALACGSVYAQDLKVAHTTATPQSQNVRAQALPPSTVALYTNLNTSDATDEYNDGNGYFVLGQDNHAGQPEQWVGTPFTVTASGETATEIEAAIGDYVASTDGGRFTLAIYSDDGSGAPNVSLGSGTAAAGTNYNTCCTLAHATLSPTVPLTAGTQYWVVATSIDATNPRLTAVWDATNLTPSKTGASPAVINGTQVGSNYAQAGWIGFMSNIPAFSVLGTR
jgi:hypothetical protein